MDLCIPDLDHWAFLEECTSQDDVRTGSTSSESSFSDKWSTELDSQSTRITDAFPDRFAFRNISTETMLSSVDPIIGQQFEQIFPISDDFDSMTGFPCPSSSGGDWIQPCNTGFRIGETRATESLMPEKYHSQQHQAMQEGIQSPVFKSASSGAGSLVDFIIEGNNSTPNSNPSQVARLHDNGSNTGDFGWPDMRERPLEIRPRSVQLSCQNNIRTKRMKKSDPNHCPVCGQAFTRQDNIRPHVERKHPGDYSSLYPLSHTTSTQSCPAPSMHQPSAHGEVSANLDLGCGEDATPTIRSTLESENKTPSLVQYSVDCSAGSTVPQKRSLNSISPEDTAVSDGMGRRSVPGRSLACPFQKRDPSQYQKCFAISLQRIKDVKQHIYRCHTKPEYYCASCYEIFDTANDRDKHSRLRECQRLDSPCLPQFEGITEDQRKQLGEKSLRTMDVKGQWFQIWSVVFPGLPRPSSVYLGNCLEELVPLLRTKWESQRSIILARAGETCSQQLSSAMNSAMDMFLESLESPEGESAGREIGNKWASLVAF